MKRAHPTQATFLFLILLLGAYLHFYGMLFLSDSHCPHEATAHAACIATMSGFAPSVANSIEAVVLPIIFLLVLSVLHRAYHQHSLKRVERVRYIVALFRRGILNPKAP